MSGVLVIKDVKDVTGFGWSYVDSLILDHLPELLEVEQGVSIDVCVFEGSLEKEEPSGAFAGQSLLDSEDD